MYIFIPYAEQMHNSPNPQPEMSLCHNSFRPSADNVINLPKQITPVSAAGNELKVSHEANFMKSFKLKRNEFIMGLYSRSSRNFATTQIFYQAASEQ
jgi:hypothetical protein